MRNALLSTLLLVCACHAPMGGTEHSMVVDQHSHSEPTRTLVKHVYLDVKLDFEAQRVVGSVHLSLERIEAGAPLVLDVEGLEIQKVKGSDVTQRPYKLEAAKGDLGGALIIELEDSDEYCYIDYSTRPDSEALQWLAPEQTAGGKAPFLFSQGQSVLTRSWIPLQDSPGVRVTYMARIMAPEGMVPVMSAEYSERLPDGSTVFKMSSPIPPYLIALACGDLEFEAISDRCGVWADPTVLASAVSELEDTERMIQSAESLFGPYRWGRYDLLILPPAFPFGGMENPCMTFATPTILAGDKSLVALVAHELAHSWSGNLVTNATWSDFWLNEGFTVYFEARIMEEVFGVERAVMEKALAFDDLVREMEDMAERDTILHIDLKGRHPDDGFSGVPYDKGALFLRRLEEVFGREAFDEFLRAWFDGHAFQSVTTADFLAFLDAELLSTDRKLAAQVDVNRWVYLPGLPETAPVILSSAMAHVDRERESFLSGGVAATNLNTGGWVTQQWLHFLEGLPQEFSTDSMAALDSAFGFTQSGNSEILCVWLRLSIRHGYAPANARLEEFLMRVGRAKFLKPIYRELMAVAPIRGRTLYAKARSRYHAVAHSSLDDIVGIGD